LGSEGYLEKVDRAKTDKEEIPKVEVPSLDFVSRKKISLVLRREWWIALNWAQPKLLKNTLRKPGSYLSLTGIGTEHSKEARN